jgi:hypothetical protein
MQLLGVLILLGILVLLLLAGIYLGSTQKTHNKPASALDDLYRSRGFGNVADANEHMRATLSRGEHQEHSRGNKSNQHHQKPGKASSEKESESS